MLELISFYSTKFLASKLNISEDAFSIYKYGFTLLYSMVFSAISICTLSFILFDSPIYAIIFIFVFVSIRIYSGGFHAKTYLSCFILNNLFFIIIMFVALSMRDFYFLFPIFSLFSSFYIYRNTPVSNSFHPISQSKVVIYQRKTKFILIIVLIITMTLYFVQSQLSLIMSLTTFLVALLMIIVNKREI